MKKYTVEFIGTFFLVMGAALGGAIGATLALMVMIYAGGHISGTHYNPAVTLAMIIRGKATVPEAVAYFMAQLAGGIAAALLVTYVFEAKGPGECIVADENLVKALAAEIIGTFALAYVVLNVATTKGTSGNSFYGIAIAGTVLAMAMVLGKFSGGVFNPAVAVGLSIQGALCWSQIWIYLVACMGGGGLAALVFNYINKEDTKTPPIRDAD